MRTKQDPQKILLTAAESHTLYITHTHAQTTCFICKGDDAHAHITAYHCVSLRHGCAIDNDIRPALLIRNHNPTPPASLRCRSHSLRPLLANGSGACDLCLWPCCVLSFLSWTVKHCCGAVSYRCWYAAVRMHGVHSSLDEWDAGGTDWVG
ncbi:hypothetical protein IQ06DRAFT_31031 [Phaeosphaeriaceae sp. SRC1lsM3a]|nr:hypothetical protein IQ06DRAFT_31031 [Stagonospora sp. SRC1lsM3a]